MRHRDPRDRNAGGREAPTRAHPADPATSDAARRGDEQAFRALAERHARELHVHCYRMVGSVADADDLVQETLLAAWRGLDGFEGNASLRAWLYRIATNRCLNAIRDGKRRPPPPPRPPFTPPEPNGTVDVPWLQPYPDRLLDRGDPAVGAQARESIELAFVTALQLLPPRQTATLLLVDVVGFTVAEVAAMIDASPTATKGLLQRARAGVARPARGSDRDRTDTPTLGAPLSAADARHARRFAEAFAADDVDGVVALLTDDAWLAMPPAPHHYRGPIAVGAFLRASAAWRDGRALLLRATAANRRPAFGTYLPDASGRTARAAGIIVLTTSPAGITGITRFLDAGLHRRFGLPDVVRADAAGAAAPSGSTAVRP